jgi:hypothetical protein
MKYLLVVEAITNRADYPIETEYYDYDSLAEAVAEMEEWVKEEEGCDKVFRCTLVNYIPSAGGYGRWLRDVMEYYGDMDWHERACAEQEGKEYPSA